MKKIALIAALAALTSTAALAQGDATGSGTSSQNRGAGFTMPNVVRGALGGNCLMMIGNSNKCWYPGMGTFGGYDRPQR